MLSAMLSRELRGSKKINFYKPQSRLSKFEDIVRHYFTITPPSSVAQACKEIGIITGVEIKSTQMRAYMKSIKLEYRKVGTIPAKASVEAQKLFYERKLKPRLKEAKAGTRTVLFMDAAHFVWGAFLGYLWCFVRLLIKAPSGRSRFNVLGALDAVTKEVFSVTNATYITGTQVCELLRKIAEKAKKPVTIVLDNARYQKCGVVLALAAELQIELLFLPPYSPNLNLIERFWKFLKKERLNSVYYETFALFSESIESFIKTVGSTHKTQLHSLLSLNFQFFSNQQLASALKVAA